MATRKRAKTAPKQAVKTQRITRVTEPAPLAVNVWSASVAGLATKAGMRSKTAFDADTVARLLPNADALVLGGGGDVNPLRYGETASRACYGISAERDALELDAVRWAVDLGVPVFGVCRGSQVMNVAMGGTLHQDLPSIGKVGHGNGLHDVEVCEDTTLRGWVGKTILGATTLHHQAVNEVGYGLRVAARHLDGTVEAIESADAGLPLMVGVQFHPEMDARYAKGEGAYALDLMGGFVDSL